MKSTEFNHKSFSEYDILYDKVNEYLLEYLFEYLFEPKGIK